VVRAGAAVVSHPIQLSPDGSPRAVDAEVAGCSAGDAAGDAAAAAVDSVP
jgi:hypothetical protein